MTNQPAIRKQERGARASFPARAFFLYGEPKVGKTTCASQFPGGLILNVVAENGTTEIAGDVLDIATPADLINAVNWLKGDPACRGYQAVTLDGISTLILDRVTKVRQQSQSRDTRKIVKDVTEELVAPLHEFLSLPCIRIITGHARRDLDEVIVENKRRVKVSVYPDLPPRLRKFIEGRVDAFGYCHTAPQGSVVRWLPLEVASGQPQSIEAGNRLGLPQMTALSFQAIEAALVKRQAPPAPAPSGQPGAAPAGAKSAQEKPGPNGKPPAPAPRPAPAAAKSAGSSQPPMPEPPPGW